MKFKPRMIGEYKSPDPLTNSAIKELKNDRSIDREEAIKVATCIFDKSPELELASICEGIGFADILSEVEEACADKIASLVTSDITENKKDSNPTNLSDFLPSANEPHVVDGPISDSTVEEAYYQKYSFVSRSSNEVFGCSDENIARMASNCLGQNNCRRIRSFDKWLTWSGSVWRQADEGDIRTLLSLLGAVIDKDLRMVRQQYRRNKEWVFKVIQSRYGVGDIQQQQDIYEQEIRTMQGIISRIQAVAGMQAILKRMGDLCMINNDELDNNSCELVFNNTYWSAKTNGFYKPRRESNATRGIDDNWSEPTEAACQRWNEYLQTFGFDDPTLQFIKRSFGYASLGLGVVKRFWWFRGVGNTSKTTLIQLIARCMGKYAEITQTKLWLVKSGSSPGHTDDLAALRGARLVYADEFPRVSRFDDSMLKQITSGGSPMRASEKGEKGFTYRIIFASFFSSNFDPHLSEEDEAAMSRLTTITFTQKVLKKDEHFVNKYLAEHDNRMAILKWVMEGALEYLESGLGEEPEAVKNSRQEFTANQVSISDQVKQIVAIGPTSNPLRLHDVLTELTKLQLETRQKGYFSNKQISKILVDEFKVTGRHSNGHIVYDGLILRSNDRRKQDYTPEIDYGYEPPEEFVPES